MGYLSMSLQGQVTAIRDEAGRLGYVRENLRIADTFLMSSNARLGITGGSMAGGRRPASGINPRTTSVGRSVLELAARPEDWEPLAKAVAEADTLHRPVLRNRAWSLRKAKAFFL